MIGPILGGVPLMRYTGASVNIVFDGNSLVAGYQASGPSKYMPAQMAALSPLSGAVTVTNIGISGQNITDMRGRGAAYADANYVAGKKNVLLAWEGTNTICNSGANADKTGLQAAADMVGYCQDRIAAHPDWHIVMMTTLPRFDTHNKTIAQQNAELQAYDDYLRANWRTMGAKALVDVRAGGIFVYTGTTMDPKMVPYMTETVHCNDAGYGLVAQYCATTLRRLPAR